MVTQQRDFGSISSLKLQGDIFLWWSVEGSVCFPSGVKGKAVRKGTNSLSLLNANVSLQFCTFSS